MEAKANGFTNLANEEDSENEDDEKDQNTPENFYATVQGTKRRLTFMLKSFLKHLEISRDSPNYLLIAYAGMHEKLTQASVISRYYARITYACVSFRCIPALNLLELLFISTFVSTVPSFKINILSV